MTPLLLGLAVATSPTAVGHPPYPRDYPGYPPPSRSWYPPAPPVPYPNPGPFPPRVPNPGPFPPTVPTSPALTLQQFAAVFVPTPGRHRVWIVHPKTCVPVVVCFTLPDCGTVPPRVRVHSRSIEFQYRRHEVEINFRHNGTVDVDYDD